MIGANAVSVFLAAGLMTLSIPSRVNTPSANKVPVAAFQAQSGQKNPHRPAQNQKQNQNRKMGEWLKTHKDLPPDQQLKHLESDPRFKKLPPERQAELRERLKKFSNLPPDKRDQAVQRMEFLAKLTPQQRQELRDANQQLKDMPQERQVMVHKAVRHLRQMPPDERKQVLESDRFRSTFSDQEQRLISQLAEFTPQENGTAQNPQPK